MGQVNGTHTRKLHYIRLGFTALLLIAGCASPDFKKGMDAYSQNRCELAYQYFKKVPGIPKAGSELADGMAKATACIAEANMSQAIALQSAANSLPMPMAEKDYFRVLEIMEKATCKYKESLDYAKMFDSTSGAGATQLHKLEYLAELKQTYGQQLRKRQVYHLLSTAAGHAEAGAYESAISELQKALLKEGGSMSSRENKKIKEQLVVAKCQHIRNQIKMKNWSSVQFALAALDTGEFEGIESDLVQCVKSEYVSAYCRATLEKSEKYFREYNLKKALGVLDSMGNISNSTVKERRHQLKLYQNIINDAFKKADAAYEKKIQKYSGYLTPELACDITEISIHKLQFVMDDDGLKKYLNSEKIGENSLHNILKDGLKNAFTIRDISSNALRVKYLIRCPNEERWHIRMEMWLEKKGVALFNKNDEATTDTFEIYQGWGPFKKIYPGQIRVLNSVMEDLARKNIDFFTPFGRCKNHIIAEFAKVCIENITVKDITLSDFNILKQIIEKNARTDVPYVFKPS